MFSRAAVSKVVLAVGLFLPSLASSSAQGDDKDVAEIRSYVLTMDNVKRTYMAMYQLKQASDKDPGLSKSLNADSDDDKKSQSLSAISARISAYPVVVAVLANNGFTPRQFVVSEMAVLQAGLAAAAVKMGAAREKLISEGAVSAANLAFAEQHHAELEDLGKKYPMQ
jgi:hypothetical protein